MKLNIIFHKEFGSIKAFKPATRYDYTLRQEVTRGTNKYFHWLYSRFTSICTYVGQTIQPFRHITSFPKSLKNVQHRTSHVRLWPESKDIHMSLCSKLHNSKFPPSHSQLHSWTSHRHRHRQAEWVHVNQWKIAVVV